MIVDTSAIASVIKGEADGPRCRHIILASARTRISVANLLEAYMVNDRTDLPDARLLVDAFILEFQIAVESVTIDQIALARDAFHRFGRGGGHGAKLNYGNCFAYALARQTSEPLLFVGNDFGQTDIGVA